MPSGIGSGQKGRLTRLGAGKFGTVYLSQVTYGICNESKVVVKVLSLASNRDARRSFIESENTVLKILKRKSHENIVRFFDRLDIAAGSDHPFREELDNEWASQDIISFWFEYANFKDLSHMIDEHPNDVWKQLTSVAKQTFAAIRHLKGLNVIHADLKPENILLHKVGKGVIVIKLADFGLSCKVSSEGKPIDASQKHVRNYIVGSPNCIAPEQLLEDSEPAFASDIWSAGACLFAVVTKGFYFPYHDVVDKFAEEYQSLEARDPAAAEALRDDVHVRMREEIFKAERPREPDWKYLPAEGFESVTEVDGWYAGQVHPGGFVTSLDDVTTFLRSILVVDSKRRPTAEEVLLNKFFDTDSRTPVSPESSEEAHEHQAPKKRRKPSAVVKRFLEACGNFKSKRKSKRVH